MMKINIKHYDGLGNTFSIVNNAEIQGLDFKQLARLVCASDHLDTDGLIILSTAPLKMIFYNKDGSISPMCGNGIRCFAKYAIDEGIVANDVDKFDVLTGAGILQVEIINRNPFLCKINMGKPIFTPIAIKLADNGPLHRTLNIDDVNIEIHSVFMGTIHTVVFVNQIEGIKNCNLGENIHKHPLFTEKTNVNFVEVLNNNEIVVRTFERGVGWTKACGTGCCASYVIAKKTKQLTADTVTVHLEEGKLTISGKDDIYMTGSARYNYSSKFKLL